MSKYSELDKKIKEIEDMHAKIKALDTFNGKNKNPINEKDLLEFPLLEWVKLKAGVWIRRKNSHFNSQYLNFECKLNKGGVFAEHFHADLIESTEVLEGKVIDLNTMKVYKQHEMLYYNKGIKHTIAGMDDINIIQVIFKR